jgi:uncharacterized membrane protein YhhN
MPTILFALASLAAILEWVAVFKGWRRLEYFAKPGVMLFLLIWLFWSGGAGGPLLWFSLGVFFSLLGDVLLLLSNERRDLPGKYFLFGLGAFLLAHVAYVLGFNSPPPPFSAMTFGVAFMVIVSALPLIRRILLGLQQKGLRRLLIPVRTYATAISLMLFSALMTLFRTDWQSLPAYLVGLGALLLITSDVLLAWNKFVSPVRRGRLLLMVTYHLGQIALVAGAAGQFGK